MKVVIAAKWYPIAIARYFEKALRNMEGIELTTVGPTSGASIPWGDEFSYPEHAFVPDYETGDNPRDAGEFVENNRDLFKGNDLWIDVDAGFFTATDETPCPHVIVATDPHALNYDAQRMIADHFFCMQRVYAQPGDHYLPYCYSQFDHYPEEVEQQYDATVLGLQYMNRVALAELLVQGGYQVYRKLGDIWDDYRRSMCAAPIMFTWSSKQDLIARVFEGLAMGRLVVTNRVPDLDHFFREDDHLVAFSGLEEAFELVSYYADNPIFAEIIAKRGQQQVQGHTYTTRLYEIFETVGVNL